MDSASLRIVWTQHPSWPSLGAAPNRESAIACAAAPVGVISGSACTVLHNPSTLSVVYTTDDAKEAHHAPSATVGGSIHSRGMQWRGLKLSTR
jgi:hypothetical protein